MRETLVQCNTPFAALYFTLLLDKVDFFGGRLRVATHRGMVFLCLSVWLFGDSVVRSRPLLFVPIPSHLIPLPPSLSRHHLVLGHSILPRNSCPFFLLPFPLDNLLPTLASSKPQGVCFPLPPLWNGLYLSVLSSRPVSVCSLREHASVLSFVSPDSLHVLDSEFKK